VSIEPAVSLINPCECCLFLDFHQNFPPIWLVYICFGAPLLVVIRPLNWILGVSTLLAFCVVIVSAVRWNLLALILEQFSFFVCVCGGFCCEGLLALFSYLVFFLLGTDNVHGKHRNMPFFGTKWRLLFIKPALSNKTLIDWIRFPSDTGSP